MLCEECGKRPATIHLKRVVNEKATEAHLCHECAHNKGELGFMNEPSFTFHNLLAGLFDPETVVTGTPVPKHSARCQSCGLSFADFRRLGHLGCNECYNTFDRQLEPLLRRIHGNTRHTGKVPQSGEHQAIQQRRKLEELRSQLREAVASEAYETAAALRDEIRRLEESAT